MSLVGRLARLAAFASLGALLVLWTSHAMCPLVVIDACVFGGAPREPRCAGLHMLCVFLWLLMRVSLVGRLARLAALASLGALLVVWTPYVMCRNAAIDACVGGHAMICHVMSRPAMACNAMTCNGILHGSILWFVKL